MTTPRALAIACMLLTSSAPAWAQEEPSPLSATFITHARTYSLFGAQLTTSSGDDLQTDDLALVVERIRPTLELWWSDWLGVELAYDLIPLVGAGGSQGVSTFAIQSLNAMRLVDLDPALYTPDSGSWVVRHNIDRLYVKIGRPGLEAQLGRQAISHGSSRMFPASDLFAPFGPGTIDTEFKRGVDALRMGLGLGEFHEIEAYVIAHQPESELRLQDWAYLLRWRAVFPELFDLSLFAGSTYARPTLGLDLSTALLGAAAYAEGSLRLATEELDESSIRATAGVDYTWGVGLQTILELHYSSLGELAPFTQNVNAPPLERRVGELNFFGQFYAGLTAAYTWELLAAALGYIQNLQDGSVLLTASLSYDFAENVAVGAGALVPLGARAEQTATTFPNPLDPSMMVTAEIPVPQSEFGLFPPLLFLDIRLTF